MGKVSIKDKADRAARKVTLKSWFQGQVNRLDKENNLKDFSKYGPLNSFYYSARAKYGGELAIKTKVEWNILYREFLG